VPQRPIRFRNAASVVYLREPPNPRAGIANPAQGRDLHAALRLSRFLAEAGFLIRDSLILEPLDPTEAREIPVTGTLSDFDFSTVDLIVQTTRPCLDDAEGDNRKPKYESRHAIERAINQSLRQVFAWLCRERVSLNPAIPFAPEQEWLRNLAFGLYRKRQDGLAEATRWTVEGKQHRLTGTTFGYVVVLQDLEEIHRPFLAAFGMSRDDTFRLACSLDRFPNLIPALLASGTDGLAVVQMRRSTDGPSRVHNVRIADDVEAQVILQTSL